MKKNDNREAIEALKKQIQRIAFDANLYDMGIADYPHAERCSERRKELQAQIAALSGGAMPDKKRMVVSQPGLF